MKAELVWHELRWPREVTPEQVMNLCRLLASVAGVPVVIEAEGAAGRVEHRLAITKTRATTTVGQLRAAVPGLAIEAQRRRSLTVAGAVELRLSTKRRPLRSDDLASVSRAVLTALANVGAHESITLQWILARKLPATAVPNHGETVGRESWLAALLLAPFTAPRPADSELRTAMRAKQAEPGWQVRGRIGVNAGSVPRTQQLLYQVIGALRSAEAPGVSIAVRRVRSTPMIEAKAGWLPPLRLNVTELAVLSSFPVGPTGELPVERIGARLLPPAKAIRRYGLVLGRSTFPGQERPLALTPIDSRRHVHVLGPTGVGKSTLLLNLAVSAMQAGRAVVVIEPKGDLIADLLARIPSERVPDVVLLDPTDAEPVGLNPLASGGRSPELVADQLLGLWHAMYSASWGPRTHEILAAALLTLARTPGMTLAALPLLLSDAGFRRRIVPKASDPIGLAPFWAAFESWSEPERLSATAPSMNKLRPLLMRPELRAVIGQRRPRFELNQVFTERKVLLCDLSRGRLGPEASALLGSLIVSQLWQAILGRVAVPAEWRHAVLVVVDEFQDYLRLPVDFADALAQARGLGASFALSHQYLHQLDVGVRSAVLANAQSRIAFRLANEDARVLASGGALTPEDFQGLAAFQAYAQLVAGDSVQPWCSLRTLPASEPTSDPEAVRVASRASYGVSRTATEAELQELFAGRRASSEDDLRPRKRSLEGEI